MPMQKITLIIQNDHYSSYKNILKTNSSEIVYWQALVISTVNKDMNLDNILTYPLTSISTIFLNNNGSKRSTSKADLMNTRNQWQFDATSGNQHLH